MTGPPYVCIIGDVHGRIAARPKRNERNFRDPFPESLDQVLNVYSRNDLDLIGTCTYSIQVSDLALDYSE